jgi:hypothetical protein
MQLISFYFLSWLFNEDVNMNPLKPSGYCMYQMF